MVESRIVIPVVVGSSPIGHPIILQRIPPVQKWMPPALDAGTAVGAAFVANIRAAIVQIRANARGAVLGHDPEHLHQVRVGIQRLHSTVRTSVAWFVGVERRGSKEVVAWSANKPWRETWDPEASLAAFGTRARNSGARTPAYPRRRKSLADIRGDAALLAA